ncbi:4-methylaminobutanoate oxidase (formaldehyde-forming) [Shimia gijangensis]|uniref:4-methylaminobutanoate oxidase (Formaldehyde-forming) n=1 Tax=Shimia gijangensis TaxID=1470563 RepID=A0A1M6PT42_9RHOB|nr:FAD-dependent oxidoreductase [Shimia gijangensis]SHK11078.1 4-methylaminobutanoate oxidase (formaldehyde-forming) [Shimia gijangensis]
MSKTIIIGGGVIGLSVAYHLAQRGASNVVLLERNQLTSGTSWHAAGIVGPLRATPNMTRLASHALKLFPQLEQETGLSTGYKKTGGYWLARETERLDELHRIADLGLTQGLTPQVVSTKDVHVPGLDLSDHVGALYVPEDGNVNPVDLCMAYARGARSGGVEIHENVQVSSLLTQDGQACGVQLADGTEIAADIVILCAGAWSKALAETAGVALPLQAVEHMYVVTEPMANLPEPFPVIRDLDRGIYIKGDAGKLVIGGFEPDAKCWNAFGPEGDRPFLELPEDWDQFAPFMEAALDLIPALEIAGIQHFMNGPESFTADTRPLVGETPQVDGLFVAAGMNSVGVMSSAGIGRALADWVLDRVPPMDMWEVDIARADPRTAGSAHMAERMQETVSDLFAMHWPYKQPKAGRNLRQSALHDHWAAKGAVFGLTAGWERGLWYAVNPSESNLPYAVGPQPWLPIAKREAAVMATGTVLIDLSPFAKLDVFGAGALEALNWLTTAQMDVAVGRAVYTQVLNENGGIEMDVTITRLSQTDFHLTSGAATRMRDLAYLRRHLTGDVEILDRTEDYCTIGVMGAGSRTMLKGLTPSWTDVPFGYATDITLAGVSCRITRVSFVGELGWEVTVEASQAAPVFEALVAAGGEPLGHYALDGCRIEKGFKHWGHDLGPEITPLEAGLGFTIDWTKAFLGKSVLEQQRSDGLQRRMVLLEVDGNALMLHDEPIYEGTDHIGLTTSGAVGARTGLNLAFGLISVSPGDTLDTLFARQFTVRVAGQDYAAKPLRRPPFDPKGERMRT